MQQKLILGLVDCPTCEKLKNLLKTLNLDKKIKYISLDKQGIYELIKEGKLYFNKQGEIPFPLYVNENGEAYFIVFTDLFIFATDDKGNIVEILYDFEINDFIELLEMNNFKPKILNKNSNYFYIEIYDKNNEYILEMKVDYKNLKPKITKIVENLSDKQMIEKLTHQFELLLLMSF